MPAPRVTVAACGLFALALFLPGRASAADEIPGQDVQGSHDNAVVSRFKGSVIVGYRQQDYASLVMPLGRYRYDGPGHFAKSDRVEGTLTRLAYVAPAGKTALEVFRNFQQALSSAGFRTRFECSGDDCGGFDFAGALADPANEAMRGGHHNLIVDVLDAANGNVHAMSARLDRDSGPVDVSLLVSQDDDQPTGILLQVVEGKAMATGQVDVDAKTMGKGLAQAGHIALYGIRFATDSARLDAKSDPTLREMAKLLQASPTMKVYIVGHTDDTGSLAHNLALSQKRAESVVAALAASGIRSDRMAAKGLASFAPVASNHDEAGRALNRRVELVEQ